MEQIRDFNFFKSNKGKRIKEEQNKLEKRIYDILETYDYSDNNEQLHIDVGMLIDIFQKKVINILED